MTVRRDDDVFVCCREVEYLKKETEQQQVQEQSQATHKEETDNLQEKVSHNDKYIDYSKEKSNGCFKSAHVSLASDTDRKKGWKIEIHFILTKTSLLLR